MKNIITFVIVAVAIMFTSLAAQPPAITVEAFLRCSSEFGQADCDWYRNKGTKSGMYEKVWYPTNSYAVGKEAFLTCHFPPYTTNGTHVGTFTILAIGGDAAKVLKGGKQNDVYILTLYPDRQNLVKIEKKK